MPSAAMRPATRVFGLVKGGDTSCVLRSGRRLWSDSRNEKTGRYNHKRAELGEKPYKRKLDEDDNEEEEDGDISILEMVKRRNRKKGGRDKHFGIVYSRKRRRRSSVTIRNEESKCVLAVHVVKNGGGIGLFSCLLLCVFRRIIRYRETLKDLSAFFLSQPISSHYASRGIYFFHQNVPSDAENKIHLPYFQMEASSSNSHKKQASESGTVTLTPPQVIEINDGLSLQASVISSELSVQNGRYQKNKSKRVLRNKTLSRKKKAPNPSTKNTSNGSLASDSKDGGTKSIITGVASNKKLRSPTNSCTSLSLSEASSAVVDSREGVALGSSYCSANLLIAESDRCYRVEGAVVALEQMPDSREWHLAVKKDGLTRCTFKAEKVMRPCSSNRYTRMRMVSLVNEWKLEFATHGDWIVFKHLYKQCADRDIPAPAAKCIPVPGVRDVYDYAGRCAVPFSRPTSYISVNGDEFFRAMTRKTANYDMDSEDEEWLSKFNNEFPENISEDNFELIVDALEKSYYYKPYDSYDEKTLANWCQNLVSKEAVAAVHTYWMRKRKQEQRPSLLRVFLTYQSQRLQPPVLKPSLRKKRSFKRHPSQINRCKLPSDMQATASEQNALEDKNEMMKIEAAEVAANEAKKLAIQKWKRARSLVEKADLAVYKATVLIRISEAAQAGGGGSVEALAEHFLD